MSRLQPVDPFSATGKGKELRDAVKAKLGIVPNMTKVMAASPVVLESYNLPHPPVSSVPVEMCELSELCELSRQDAMESLSVKGAMGGGGFHF